MGFVVCGGFCSYIGVVFDVLYLVALINGEGICVSVSVLYETARCIHFGF